MHIIFSFAVVLMGIICNGGGSGGYVSGGIGGGGGGIGNVSLSLA